MFKNPLKYQQGGTTAQQQKLVQIFSTAATKLNIQPEILLQKVQQLEGNDQIAFVQAIQDIAENDNPKPESVQLIQSAFGEMSQSFKEGGKIHDFICKHSKGGIAGCGCAKKGEDGMVVEEPEGYTWGQYNRSDFLESGPDHEGWVKVETPDGRIGYAKNYRRRFLGIPSRNLNQVLVTPGFNGKMRSSTRNLNGFFGNGQIDTVRNTYDGSTVTKNFANSMDYALEGVAPERKQEGGELTRKQRGGYLIPDMSFVSLGEVPGYSRNITEGAVFAPIVGERAIVDGNDVFIPNRQISAALVWGKDPNEVGVLEPGAGYTDEGRVAYTPAQIRARKKEGMTDTAHAQNEKGLVESNQEGGELTRKQALGLGIENKGFTRSQARFALRNAKNTLRESGARGKQMRQTARQWVAGQNEQPQSRVLSAPISYGESLPAARQMNYPTEHNESLANLPFNDAFARARRAGAQTFWWPRGRYKLYNTELGTSGNQANGTGNSAEIVAIPNLPVIDTNFNIPDIVIDESTIPQVTLNLADTTPVVNIPGIPEPIVQSAKESAVQPTTESSQPNNSNYFVQEYLKTHFPNGSRRNIASRWIYGQQRNLVNETSPLFIGPVRPGTTQGR